MFFVVMVVPRACVAMMRAVKRAEARLVIVELVDWLGDGLPCKRSSPTSYTCQSDEAAILRSQSRLPPPTFALLREGYKEGKSAQDDKGWHTSPSTCQQVHVAFDWLLQPAASGSLLKVSFPLRLRPTSHYALSESADSRKKPHSLRSLKSSVIRQEEVPCGRAGEAEEVSLR